MNRELTPREIETLAELAEEGTEDLLSNEITVNNSESKTFYGSDYPTARSTEAKNRAFMATALKDLSDREREIVLRTAMETDIKGDDPLFIFLIATGKIELLLHQKPAEIAAHFDKQYRAWRKDWQRRLKYSHALFKEHAKTLQNYINQTQETLEIASEAALEAHSDKITDAANIVIKKAALTKIGHDAVALTKAAFYIFLSVSLGTALGLAIPHIWKTSSPELDPKGARQLTLEEAKALEWAMSDVGKSARNNPELVQWATSTQGQYARELMGWNQVLLTKRGGKFLCEKDAQKLGVVLRLEGRETKTGFCTLWVRFPSERRYLE
ncbi:hypothetical protein Sta7437_4621 (plasmid) [Stanieria cyanosphaera PCC 7437]|uniref:Uncharacterized protein n=1 Tax=Stanieria cyanosphaera (strain ATCC 29371 / PCC 7437) TaxID=111780 RepID=K9Y189_STAC7|nr:DUF6753 family protein [Stanieria cyanosphaera]AFZ38079.1 hypothetical protein Sta7437_4621 [Stanieria cyanosphaera PCC 7437]